MGNSNTVGSHLPWKGAPLQSQDLAEPPCSLGPSNEGEGRQSYGRDGPRESS